MPNYVRNKIGALFEDLWGFDPEIENEEDWEDEEEEDWEDEEDT